MTQFPGRGSFPQEPFPSSPELSEFAGQDEFTPNMPPTSPFGNGWGSSPDPSSPFSAPAQQPQEEYYDQYDGDDQQQEYYYEDDTSGNVFSSAPAVYDDEDPLAGLSPEVAASVEALFARITDDECSEVIMNGPAEILIKVKGQRFHDPAIDFVDAETYHAVINDFLLAYVETRDRIDGSNPMIDGQLEIPPYEEDMPPALARVHILCPPLTPFAKVTIAKKARYEYDVDLLAESGSMSPEMADFLKAIAHARLTFVISGVTGAGKTTLLQAMSHYFDPNDRIIVVEDTPELRLPIADVVYLTSTVIKPGQDQKESITIEWLVRQAQRMRMDRVIVGEVRGAEMYEFLLAANSGADGSATTVHADSPRRALDKMLALASKGAGNTQEMTIRREIAATVNVIVQASLIDGRHVITSIEEVSSTLTAAGLFSSQTLFRYDKSRGYHVVENALSDNLKGLLQMRGVALNPAWFPRGRI